MSRVAPFDGAAGAPADLGLPDSIVRALIADELDRIRTVLEDMGMQLCGDPEIVRGHMNVLQSIDEICQRNDNLARTLRSSNMISEAHNITLETLRVRLQEAIFERMAERAVRDPSDDEAWHDI